MSSSIDQQCWYVSTKIPLYMPPHRRKEPGCLERQCNRKREMVRGRRLFMDVEGRDCDAVVSLLSFLPRQRRRRGSLLVTLTTTITTSRSVANEKGEGRTRYVPMVGDYEWLGMVLVLSKLLVSLCHWMLLAYLPLLSIGDHLRTPFSEEVQTSSFGIPEGKK
ncbi:hypothetical protein EDD18DRAFT_169673 [Armillaria luteobubalina]|uniref:Transmembrane protein n=1 Tax=Armillaria luteobubalina TaxID=153913 RepID=A0AA39P278_9AGAR|nr:hypothetical protein EDD18DRAFT_169673 [Armillaria luteobubalina]